MKRFVGVMCCMFLAGYMTIDAQDSYGARDQHISEMKYMTRRFISLRQVHVGMTRSEVGSVLAFPVITGYELSDPQGQQYKPITQKNPYRTEVFEKNRKSYTIDYYLVGIKNQDDKIADEELVPLVYHDKKLIGLGWEYVEKIKM